MKIFKESITNLKRNRFLALASIVSISLILMIFNVLLTVNSITKEQIQNLTDKINLNIYIENSISEQEINQVYDYLSKLPEVESVKKISNQESLNLIQEQYPDSSDFLKDFNIKNPLPNTLQVKTKQLEDKDRVINLLQNSEYADLIFKSESKNEYNQTITTVINNLINIRDFSFQIILWVMVTFVICGSLIMFNAIKTTLFSRRNEIQIMQFVGATFKKIMLPFILEGILLGIFGFILNLILLTILNGFLPFSSFTALTNPIVLLLQLLIASAIGMITSAYVVHKYLNTREIFND